MLIVEVEPEEEEEEKQRLVEGNLWSEEILLKFREYGDENGCGGGGAVRSSVMVGCNGEKTVDGE